MKIKVFIVLFILMEAPCLNITLMAQFSTSVSLSSLTPVSAVICDGNQLVTATVTNNDPVQPTDGPVAISYSIDGVQISASATSAPLAPGASEPVLLGNFSNKPGKHRISATVLYSGNTSPFITLTSNLTVKFSGSYTIGAAPADNFFSLKQAVDTINAYGICGPTTINCTNGHTETNSGILLNTLSTSVTNTLTFNGNGAIITAGTGSSTNSDGIIIIAGSNYVTFDGFTLRENAANTSPTTRMEWGFAILKRNGVSPLKGVWHLTIRNCNISLNKANNNSVGIYANNHLPGGTTPLLPQIAADLHCYNSFYNNIISNVFTGIMLVGSADYPSFNLSDKYNEIGVAGKNTIYNFSGGTAPPNPSYGIYCAYQDYLKIANDSINGGSGQSPNIAGIFVTGMVHDVSVTNNIISVFGSATNCNLYGIYNQSRSIGSGKISINNNVIKNCRSVTSNIASFNAIYIDGLFNGFVHDTIEISDNTLKNNRFNPATTSYNYAINYEMYSNSGRTGTIKVHDNLIFGNRNLTNGSNMGGIRITIDSLINNAFVRNNHISYDTSNGSYWGIIDQISVSNDSNNCINNEINNIVSTASASYQVWGINFSDRNGYLSGNSIHDFTGAGTFYGIETNKYKQCNNNAIYNFWGGGCFGIYATTNTNYNGAAIIRTNKIYHFIASGSAGFSKGIDLKCNANNLVTNIYNNDISDLSAPNYSTTAPEVIGINASVNYTSNINLFYNTVFLNAFGLGTDFASCGIYLYSNASGTYNPAFLVKNNLIVNASVPSGSGKSSALGLYLNNMGFYSLNSDYNCYSAGNPGPLNHLVYNYKTGAAFPTLTQLQSAFFPMEQHSFYENPPFINSTTPPFNLHLRNDAVTLCESGASRITTPLSITADLDGVVRWGESGYTGNGEAPDVGAYEGDYQAVLHVNLGNDTAICAGQPYLLNAGPGYSYVWSNGDTTQSIIATATANYSVTVTGAGNQIAYGSVYVTVMPSLPVSVNISSSADSICEGTLVSFTANAINGGTNPVYQWQVNGVNLGTNSPQYVFAPLNNDVITCSLTSGLSGCLTGNPSLANPIVVTVFPQITAGLSITADQTIICPNTSVTFTATAVNGGTPSFEWKRNGTTVPGEISPVFITTNLNNGDVISCVMVSNAGPCLTGSLVASNSITITVIQPPACAGITGPLAACEGSLQNFSISCSNTNYYSWNYTGNGSIANPGSGPNVSVNVGTSGGQLCVTPSGTCATPAPVCTFITVNPLPLAGFAVNSNNLPVVTCTNSALNATSFLWNFGDGTTSVLPDPSHTYLANGSYTITLIVSNNCGSDTASCTISVLNVGLDERNAPIKMQISPNPSSGKIRVLPSRLQSILEFYDPQGQLLMIKQHELEQEEFDISFLPDGIYFVRMRCQNGVGVVKLIKN